ncbi:RagB/SusD family nutrient uptake outer membrane protein [Nibrella viscosa]|uniref:RagB/SusD family nutrient uptake outer membrane protein n=1 Tax=Nibrella viscosa TaxID=1084524 RepID=A0ABP8KST1_9BACT
MFLNHTYQFSKWLPLVALLSLSACDQLLDVQPRQSISSSTALSTPEGIDAALNGIYDRLQSPRLYGRDLIAIPEALSDNGRATNKSGRLNAEYLNQVGAHFATWQLSYYAINQANLVLESLPNITDEATRDRYEGEAKFLRALLYFDLMRAYAYEPGVEVAEYNRGGVPLLVKGVLTPDQIQFPARAPIADVYKQIYEDLTVASTKLNNARGQFYANRGAALALFSRVALYNKDYANAVKYATDALAAGPARFLDRDSYLSGWRANRHPESFFEVTYTTPENIGVNESLQTTYTTLVALGDRTRTGGFGDLVPSASLLTALEAEKGANNQVLDIRRQLYELGTTGRGTAEIETTKFFGKNGAVNLDNVPVIRASEMYLNRAEANYFLGKEAEALADVNAIRTRAGLPARTDLKGTDLLTEILRQRRIELAFEGQRWFDLKRRGVDIVKTPTTVPYIDFRLLAQIPVREITNNPNLRQNFGY